MTKKNHAASEENNANEIKTENDTRFGIHFDAAENMRFNPYDNSLEDVVRERMNKLSQEIPSSEERKQKD